MRVIISAGGTGGHIYPALAIIHKIKEKEPESTFIYIGTHNRMEKDIVPKEGIPFRAIEMYGFNKKNIFSNIKVMRCIVRGYYSCRKIMKEFKPDIVIGVGGYITVPVVMAAHKLGVKTMIHEQNSIPGKANLFLSKYVNKIAVSFQSSLSHFPSYKTVFTGNPCSEAAIYKTPIDKKTLGLDPGKKLVLIVMGSLGASKMNTYLLSCMESFKNQSYEVLFVTGKKDYEEIRKNTFPKNVFVLPYIDNMTRVMKQTDVIVSRAGASTLSEIIALKLPSILIPSPYVPNNHQYKNAMDLVKNEAAILLEEKDLTGDILPLKIAEALTHDVQRKLKNGLKKSDMPKSATKIYEEMKKIIDRK